MAPKKTIWPLEPHSVGKHLVLKSYLDAWLPKLGRWSGRIVFVDGFCGPGRYEGGEPGSPIVALDAYTSHTGRLLIGAKVFFLFGDEDQGRLAHLKSLIDARGPLPPTCEVAYQQGDFSVNMGDLLDGLEAQGSTLAPAFFMLDPFGVSDTPYDLVRRILRHQKSEVYISLMYEAINRFKTRPEFVPHLDKLFGTAAWRDGYTISDPAQRKAFFYDLYESQLKKAGASHVVRFELYEENRLVYAIFFATHSWHGSNVMKQAIWKIDPFGTFRFVGSRSGALFGSSAQLDPRRLTAILEARYRGRGWVTIDEIEEFVGSGETDYHTSQIKTPVLKPLEEAGFIEVDGETRKKRGTYPKGTRIRFP